MTPEIKLIRNQSFKPTMENLVGDFLSAFRTTQITQNSTAAKLLCERIKTNNENIGHFLVNNAKLISEASGIDLYKNEEINYSELLEFLQKVEKLVKSNQI